MRRDMGDYRPKADVAAALARAWELVNSVQYQVSARWLFYRLLQEGYYGSKGDYSNKFLKAVSNARHAFYNGWRPDTLADETREAIRRGVGFSDGQDWLTALSERIVCSLDRWRSQPYYVEIWYEARAMTDQFRHYTEHITLRPMGGHPSIPYKWNIAKDLERAAQQYEKPIVVLYFGDLDKAGATISEVATEDIRKWCGVEFEFIHVGLTEEQVLNYSVPENYEKPGEYQWEALPDDAASEIITGAVSTYVRQDALTEVASQESQVTDWLRAELVTLAGKWNGL